MPATFQLDDDQAGRQVEQRVPKTAFRLPGGSVRFADDPADDPADGGALTSPITLLARTGDPINHWFWGKVVHDLSGMQLADDRLPIDWSHTDELIGYADRFSIESGDLVADGEIVRYGDRSNEIVAKGRAGVPYAASIFFDPDNGLAIEEIGNDVTAEVNGRQVAGPALIFRQWTLRGIAVTPYGADPGARAQLSAGGDAADVTVTFNRIGDTMPATTKPTATPAAGNQAAAATDPAAAATTTPPADQVAGNQAANQGDQAAASGDPAAGDDNQATGDRDAIRGELARYTAAFGAENGTAWFTEGVEWSDAWQRQAENLAEQLTAATESHATELAARDATIEDLRGRLAAVNLGEETPPAPGADGQNDQATELAPAEFAELHGDNVGRFRAGIKLPGRE